MAQRPAQWVLWRAGIDPRRLIFIDETWAKTNMTRTRGRCERGERLIARIPHGHWKTTALLRTLACRTTRALWNSMQSVLDAVTPTDTLHYFQHRGYTLHGR